MQLSKMHSDPVVSDYQNRALIGKRRANAESSGCAVESELTDIVDSRAEIITGLQVFLIGQVVPYTCWGWWG